MMSDSAMRCDVCQCRSSDGATLGWWSSQAGAVSSYTYCPHCRSFDGIRFDDIRNRLIDHADELGYVSRGDVEYLIALIEDGRTEGKR